MKHQLFRLLIGCCMGAGWLHWSMAADLNSIKRAGVKDGFTFAAGGDMIGPREPSLPRGGSEMEYVANILRAADAAFGNLEGSLFDRATFPAIAAPENGGGYPVYAPSVAADYKALGIDMVSRANNHAIDWGIEGMRETARILDAAGIVHAGSGADAATARAPAYFQSAKGKVALISAASTFPPMAAAGEIGTRSEKRPGIFALRTQQILLVTPVEMETLRRVAARQDFEGVPVHDPKQIMIGGQQTIGAAVFRISDTPGQTFEVNAKDRAAILDAIKTAASSADFVVFTIHAHERRSDGQPADFIQPLFHDIIDAGADVIVRHGPHYLNGVEIYKGKPIFYDMGSLFTALAPIKRFTGTSSSETESARQVMDIPPEWNDSAIAVSEFRGGQVSEIRLYPLVINDEGPLVGLPRPAPPDAAERILKQFQVNSDRYGTRIRIENGMGIIRPN